MPVANILLFIKFRGPRKFNESKSLSPFYDEKGINLILNVIQNELPLKFKTTGI
jgi:hypothetical protein